MLKPFYRNSFVKDLKLLERRRKNLAKLQKITAMITAEEPLPARCRPHALHGDREGFTECHVENDWVLIYKISAAHTEVIFHSTGTHSDLL